MTNSKNQKEPENHRQGRPLVAPTIIHRESAGGQGRFQSPAPTPRQPLAASELQVARELPPGTTLCDGKYVIEKVIGTGGFGIIYYAKHVGLEHYYAIKEFYMSSHCARNTLHNTVALQDITPEVYAKFKSRFVEEAKTIVSFDHPGIVRVTDVFEENNTAYFVMPFVKGDSLQKVVEKKGKLTCDEAINYISQISDAVAYVHKHHVLHRDLKPENVMITPDNRTILLDFGSARAFVNDAIQKQTSILTQGYAPPEQYVTHSKKGNYSDIYSLGAILYFCLTGVIPEDAAARAVSDFTEPQALNPKISKQVNKVIMKSLELKPENRYQTVEEFMADLHADASAPIPKPIIQKRTLIMLAAIGGVLLLAGLAALLLSQKSTPPTPPPTSVPVAETVQQYKLSTGDAYTYEGELNEQQQPHGKGVATFADGVYEGNFANGVIQGEGTFTKIDGDKFTGTFENNHFVKGEYFFKGGSKWEGDFSGDELAEPSLSAGKCFKPSGDLDYEK